MRTNRYQFCFLIFVLCFLISTLCSSQAQAANFGNFGKGPVHKLSRGLVHILAAPFQIPKEIIQTTAEAEPVYLAPWKGMTLGAGTGLFYAGRQVISGFYDLFTFASPAGRDWAPLFEPATLFPEI